MPSYPIARRRALFLLGFGLYFILLWTFWETPATYPLKIFVVFLHEISHGLVAIATGGSIQGITLDPRLGGACACPGGNAFLTLSAGYLGSLAWGGLLLESGRWAARRPDRIVRVLGLALAVLTVLFVRGVFGVVFGLAFGFGLIWVALRLSPTVNRTALNVLGLTSCLYALLDIKGDVIDRPELPSDAFMLSQLTGIPTEAWGALWIALALAASTYFFMRAYRGS